MALVRSALLFFTLLYFNGPCSCAGHGTVSNQYTNSWAVHLPNADNDKANSIAERHGMINLGQVGTLEGFYHFKHLSHPSRMKREIVERTSRLSEEPEVKWVEQQVVKRRTKRDNAVPNSAIFKDPLWNKQWYLHNDNGAFHGYDHNVIPVWKELNITGRGISVSILDDGIQKDHPDLKENYDPDASYDFNSHDADPSPRDTYNNENRHGTRCAGEVAAMAGNNDCGVGVAYGAKVGGIRMLDGDVTDLVEAHSLSFNPQHIDIYSSSWGPDDDGKTVDGPGPLAKQAFEDGIAKGRDGLGNIFVWASGNGGRDDDNCNCDGYTNSIFTLSISSATEHGTSPWYSEYCASTHASTFSSGGWQVRKIVTTDLHGKCTESHTGTSASAPLAAGILALALEANPKLTWRDMQHIVVRTSKPDKLQTTDWVTNGVGRKVSHRFGYGLLDGKALVDTALKWKNVPEKHACIEKADTQPRTIPSTGSLSVEKETSGCEDTSNYIRYLEHVEVVISLTFTRRGDLTIHLTSPSGTRSTLLGKRRLDYSAQGFKNWVFMSTHTWEENPKGKWKLEVANAGSNHNSGTLTSWQLRFHGTQDAPGIGFENCDSECKNGCQGPSANDCVECANYKSSNACVKECPANEYGDEATKKCFACHNSCLECSGPNNNDCKTCKVPQVLYDGKCVEDCPEGWFANKDKHCEKCDRHCLSCDTNATFCTACKEDHKLLYNRCIIDCKKNEYVENDRCRSCHPSCAACKNSTAWSCTQCNSTTVTRESVQQSLYLHRGMCVTRCPSGFYGNNHQCLPCHPTCKHCKGPLNTECTSCKAGLVQVTNGSTVCLDNCPTGYSHGISENSCIKCASDCSACDPDQPSRCTACERDLFLWKQKCVTADVCPKATYPEPLTHKCEYCHPSCETCVDPPTHCTSCSGYLNLHGDKCMAQCPTGTYGKENKCLPCVANCSSCFGGGENQCLKCSNHSYFLKNKCVKQCPRGMFVEKTSGKCQPCSITCESCLDNATNCGNCKDDLKKIDGLCQSVCEDGRFLNGTVASSNDSVALNKSTNHCSKCHTSCLTCTGASKFECLRCKGVKFLDPTNKLCSLNCPTEGFYEDIKSTHCKPCPSKCEQCSSVTSCTKCVTGLVLHGAKCLPRCPSGFYADRIANICKQCDRKCKECAQSPSSCLSCDPPRILLNHQCLSECPPDMFLSKAFNRCLPCDDSCETCVGPGQTHCTSCGKNLVSFQAQCRSVCPARYYFSPFVKQCQPCDYYCHKCIRGNGLSSCTECIAPFVLENNMCVRTCSPGLVLDQEKRTCIPCHKSCSTCLGPTQHECLSCSDNKASLEGSVCKQSCGMGKYRDPQTSYCENCHPSCKRCSGGGPLACSACIDGHLLSSSECLSTCPDGKYRHNGDCYMCTSSCETCKGPSRSDCLSCTENHRLYNFTCVKQCPPGTYEERSNGFVECRNCHMSCATCSGKTADHCWSCRLDLYLQKTSCLKQCSVNFLLDENTRTCKLCDADCPAYANLKDRSVPVPRNDRRDGSPSIRSSRFVLIAVATAVTLLAMFAVCGAVRARSSVGYTKIDNTTSPNADEQRDFPNNNVPSVYIHDNMEREAMLNYEDSEL